MKEKYDINKKYKIINEKEYIMNKYKKDKLDKKSKEKINDLIYDKKIENILNIKKLNEIIYNTYNKHNNNYYCSINIKNIILNYIEDKEENKEKKLNFNNKEIKNEIKNDNIKNNNYIISEVNINEYNKKIRIINSFEQYIRENKYNNIKKEDYYKYENEKEIKKNCQIKINNENIKFSYYY